MREPPYVGKIGTLVNLLKLWQNKNNQTFVVMLGFCMSFFLQQADDSNPKKDMQKAYQQ